MSFKFYTHTHVHVWWEAVEGLESYMHILTYKVNFTFSLQNVRNNGFQFWKSKTHTAVFEPTVSSTTFISFFISDWTIVTEIGVLHMLRQNYLIVTRQHSYLSFSLVSFGCTECCENNLECWFSRASRDARSIKP